MLGQPVGGGHDRPPSYRPPAGAAGVAAISGADSFIMQADGKAWLFAPAGLADGPLPAHYEPQESPFRNLLYGQQHNPVRQIIRHRENRYQPSGDQPGSGVFPYRGVSARRWSGGTRSTGGGPGADVPDFVASAENRNPPSTRADCKGSAASVSSAGPATARAHAAARRVGDRCLSHAPTRRPSALTTLSVTDRYPKA